MDKYEKLLNEINNSLWEEVKFPLEDINKESKSIKIF